ncbi:MAG: SAM-dependent methyltransferase [Polyangiales bacterium]
MREDATSRTALIVAFARGLATEEPALAPICQDPCAVALLPRRLSGALRLAIRTGTTTALRTASGGLVDHLALRTGLIDRAVAQAVAEGTRQVVVLGAGLDARAHRLDALAEATVFEVDHPATQAHKRRAASALAVRARSLRYVACDFEGDALERALAASGFDPDAPTVWIWEGVPMYLPEVAVRATLAALARLSAEGSLLIATYVTPQLVSAGPRIGRVLLRLFDRLEEPIRYTATPDDFAARLAEAGFFVLTDAAPKDAAPYYGVERHRPTSLTPAERIVVATQRGASS